MNEVESLIKENKVMVFSKDYCPFCKQSKSLLEQKGIKYKAVEMDLIQNGKEIHNALK